jgi:hypothetical protein
MCFKKCCTSRRVQLALYFSVKEIRRRPIAMALEKLFWRQEIFNISARQGAKIFTDIKTDILKLRTEMSFKRFFISH